MVGAGASGGSMDASNMLKPALARGSLHFVGATTLNEYRKYVEKDGALARRFQPVYVKEPSVEDTVSILRGLKAKYELHHRVHITDGAIVAAALMSQRYLTERKLPDKAVDLIDEAAARLRMQQESKPDHVYALERALLTGKIELEALKGDKDKATQARRAGIEERVKAQEAEYAQLTTQWEAEKSRKAEYNSLKERLDKAELELQAAMRAGDYNTAGQLKHVTIPQLQQQIEQQQSAEEGGQQQQQQQHDSSEHKPLTLLGESVTSEDVAAVVARHTGIPVSRLLVGERERLLHMEDRLRQRVVGQDKAVASISNCIRIARAGLHQHTKPMGCFIFLGPSGVGQPHAPPNSQRHSAVCLIPVQCTPAPPRPRPARTATASVSNCRALLCCCVAACCVVLRVSGKTELAKALADFLFDDDKALVRIDMSEYMERHSVSRLIGAPPGYVRQAANTPHGSAHTPHH